MNWTQDTGDYSWIAEDALGYFYRVQKVAAEDGTKLWVCAWSESRGFRIGAHAWRTAEDAKDHMNWIASDTEMPAPACHGPDDAFCMICNPPVTDRKSKT